VLSLFVRREHSYYVYWNVRDKKWSSVHVFVLWTNINASLN